MFRAKCLSTKLVLSSRQVRKKTHRVYSIKGANSAASPSRVASFHRMQHVIHFQIMYISPKCTKGSLKNVQNLRPPKPKHRQHLLQKLFCFVFCSVLHILLYCAGRNQARFYTPTSTTLLPPLGICHQR